MDGGQILCPVVRHTLRPTPFLTLVDNSTQYLLLASARANPTPSYPLYSKHPVGIFSYMPCSDSHENHAAKQTKFSCIHFLFCMCWQRTNVIFEPLLRWFLRAIHSTQEPILLFSFFFQFFLLSWICLPTSVLRCYCSIVLAQCSTLSLVFPIVFPVSYSFSSFAAI